MAFSKSLGNDFADLIAKHLGYFVIEQRGCQPCINGIGFREGLRKLRFDCAIAGNRFWAAFYAELKNSFGFTDDDEIFEAFHLAAHERPVDGTAEKIAATERKRAQAERLRAEAEEEENQAFALANQISGLKQRLPFMREQLDYYENVLPGELRGIIANAQNTIDSRVYSLAEHRGGPASRLVIDCVATIIAAERALKEHPAQVARLRKELEDTEAELERLEPSKPSKKRKAA